MNDLSAFITTEPASVLPTTPVLSFVVPACNEEDCIVAALRGINRAALNTVNSHEIIVVDDGSADTTYERACELCREIPLRVIRLSRNFGKEQALMAGLEAAKGAAVVTIDADGQEPLGALQTMVDHWRNGYSMAFAVRAHRRDERVIKRLLARLFYKALNLGNDVSIPADARDFRLMDRKVVNAITSLQELNRFMKGLYGWVGFKSVAVPVELESRRGGSSKFGFQKLTQLALTGVTSFTAWPLRVWTGLGTAVAAMSLTYGAFLAARTLIFGADLPGWSTLAVATLFLGGVQLISIGVLGEYVARIFTEVKGRPGFIVECEYSTELAAK